MTRTTRHLHAAFRLLAWSAAALVLVLAPTARAADPVRGETLYLTYCLDCHGSLQAVTNATVLNARSLATVLREGIANPRSGMGFLGDILTTADVDSIVAYLGTSTARIAFGDQPLGGASAPRSITVQAGREELTSLRASVQGDFTVAATTCGTSLAAGSSCSVDVRFEPQGAGSRSGLLSIIHSGVTTPVRISLDGQGRVDLAQPAALLTLDARLLEFGAVTAGQASAEASLIVRNSGNADLSVLSAVAPVGFALRNDCTAALRPGDNCRLAILFQPAAIGPVAGDLVITSNQAAGVVRLPLKGEGAREAARLSWSGNLSRVEFSSTPIGRTSTAQSRMLINHGPGSVTLEALTVTGSEAGEFEIDAASTCQAGLTLPADSQCSVLLTFTPRSAGDRSARLTVQASAQLPSALALAGAATPATVTAAATNLGAGGCTLGGGHDAFDPWWPVLTCGALAVLLWRRWQGRVARRHRPDRGSA